MDHVVTFILNRPPLLVLSAFIVVGIVVGVFAHIFFLRLSTWLSVHKHISEHHDISGHFLGVVGVIYAVLIAFVVITAWQEFDHTEELSMQEQHNVSDLFHLLKPFAERPAALVRGLLVGYTTTMHDEWNQMQLAEQLCLDKSQDYGTECRSTNGKRPASYCSNMLAHLIEENVIALAPKTRQQQVIYEKSIDLTEKFSENREHRRHHYQEHPLEPILWFSFVFGGLILVGATYFVSGQDWRSQLVRTCALCATIGMMWALALAFDYPFAGVMRISGDEWDTLTTHFKSDIVRQPAVRNNKCSVRGCNCEERTITSVAKR